MSHIESWVKLYSWLCRCYGPYHIPENEFYYWVNYFFNIKEPKTKILETYVKSGLIEKNDKGLATKKCDNFTNQTTKKKVENSLETVFLANSQ